MSIEYISYATNQKRTIIVDQLSPKDDSITVVEHGADANVSRPSYAKVVYWIGSVEPSGSLDYDLWVDTSV